MSLRPETVANTLKIWNVLFPYRKKDEELAVISAKFFKVLSPLLSDKAFRMAADIVEENEEQFPTIAHMRKLVNVVADKIVRERDLTLKALPEETELTPEEIRINLEKIKVIRDMLSGKLSTKAAVEKQKGMVKYVAK